MFESTSSAAVNLLPDFSEMPWDEDPKKGFLFLPTSKSSYSHPFSDDAIPEPLVLLAGCDETPRHLILQQKLGTSLLGGRSVLSVLPPSRLCCLQVLGTHLEELKTKHSLYYQDTRVEFVELWCRKHKSSKVIFTFAFYFSPPLAANHHPSDQGVHNLPS